MSIQDSKLLTKTKKMFLERKNSLTINIISSETNIPTGWLYAFPDIENPGVKQVERLYNYLNKKNLKV